MVTDSPERIAILASLCALGGRSLNGLSFGQTRGYPRYCSPEYRNKDEKDKNY